MKFNRRRFLQGAAGLAPLLGWRWSRYAAEAEEPGAEHTLLVGTQTGTGSSGIYAYSWDATAGRLRLLGLAAATPMPTFLTASRDRGLLFAANETDMFHGSASGGVSSYRIAADPGKSYKVQPVSSAVADGKGTCNVGLDHTGKVLLCANYGGGSAASFQVSDAGEISPAISQFHYTGSGPNKARQEASHVHRATASPGNGYALFNDLGLDKIHIYKMDAATAKLTPHEPAAWEAPAGSGPRALRFHPNGRWAYCVTELSSQVIQLEWDEARGTLTTKNVVSLTPPDFHLRSQASEVAIDRAGRFAYVADRYYDGLYSFVVDEKTGALRDVERTEMAGKTPRYITLDPTEQWLLSADQDSDTIEIFARNPKTGRLAAKGMMVPQTKPQCLLFV